jgi:cytochrome d ubiquinol oxidase subunit II
MVALGLSFFPNVIPFRINLWNAASNSASHAFVLIGALVATPVILAYTAFAYWVFHGKTPADGWD